MNIAHIAWILFDQHCTTHFTIYEYKAYLYLHKLYDCTNTQAIKDILYEASTTECEISLSIYPIFHTYYVDNILSSTIIIITIKYVFIN